MEFKRIDHDTVRCIITEEDMQEYNVELEDFFKDKGKIQEFLHTVVQQAVDEVGFEPKDGMVSMQVMPMSQNRIAITFSENSIDEVGGILKQLTGMASEIDELVHKEDDKFVEEEKSEGLVGTPKKAKKDTVKKEETKERKTRVQKNPLALSKRIYRFSSLEDLEEFAKVIPEKWTIRSDLFKDSVNGIFYLVIEKGRLSKMNYAYLCNCITEYSSYVTDNGMQLAYMEEHYECLIQKKAIKVMHNMALA